MYYSTEKGATTNTKIVDIDLDKHTVSTIEMLEALQNYSKIENISN